MKIVVDTNPVAADYDIIADGLLAFNAAASGRPRTAKTDFAVLLRDDDGATVGGLWGAVFSDWLFIELLYVPDSLRGQDLGSQLMAKAEGHARAQDLTGIWLDTYSFQARPFYEKLGFAVVGEIVDMPPGSSRYFLSKPLKP
ncbi:GNAT family N-acetyltransferase [Devosia sp. BSSL-BM10]|uniref:GNAT family N-acetyltransferase n=1 Tax=Devosia litorisediminis TaxID=2829817 RepID=A0A942E902_9HYPH|nr:GNAT family N-acetyltransferase [Devosia litorisediminis]MBS3850310.1 GNAT family N-acetyltransferase [Devosia litorisediminis]